MMGVMASTNWLETLLSPSQNRSIFSAASASSNFLNENFVRSREDFFSFKNLMRGLPILVPADNTIFEFSDSDVFELSYKEIAELVYGKYSPDYVGFRSSFYTTVFLSNFRVKPGLVHLFDAIERDNLRAEEHVQQLLIKYQKVGAFQTRNIPHFGHERILERMLDLCDHLVVNPVMGPKKRGDVTEECLKRVFGEFFKSKYGDKISFIPVYANMYYGGPREAVHHALLRQRIGFTHFSVGRDHAGAEGFFNPLDATNLIRKFISNFTINIFCHSGAKLCNACKNYVIDQECGHDISLMEDVSGSKLRQALEKRQHFVHADLDMQDYVLENVTEIFEV